MRLQLSKPEIHFILECMDMWESDHISHMNMTEVRAEDVEYLEKLRNKIYRELNRQEETKPKGAKIK